MKYLKVEIIEIDESAYPGFITCVFNDVYGKKWELFDKLHFISEKEFTNEKFLKTGFYIAGEIIAQDGNIACFRTMKPIQADSGENIFHVYMDQLSDSSDG